MEKLRFKDAAKSDSPDSTLAVAGSGANRAPWQAPAIEEMRISGAAHRSGGGGDGGGIDSSQS